MNIEIVTHPCSRAGNSSRVRVARYHPPARMRKECQCEASLCPRAYMYTFAHEMPMNTMTIVHAILLAAW